MKKRRESGKVECKKVGMQEGGIQKRRDAVREGCRKGGMQERRDAGKEGFRKGGI